MHHVSHGTTGCRGSSREFTLPGASPHYPPDISVEPVHLDLRLRVDVRANRLTGVVTHDLVARSDGRHTLSLDAVDFEDLEVGDADGRATRHEYDGRRIHVVWDEAWHAGETRRLAVRYRVEKPTTGLFFSGPSEHDPAAPLWAATDHETERARYWLPTIDLPNVRPTLAFHVEAEEGFTVLANGKRVGEASDGDGWKTVDWTLEQPCPSYITCFAVGDFVSWDGGSVGDVPVAAFTTKLFSSEDLSRSFGRTAKMLAWMQEKLDCPYPYPKYFQFALPAFGGAMENISLVSWDDQFVLDEALAREWTWLVDKVNVHEMGHSYFGDMLVCRDYAHAWLKESWATYMEQLWFEHALGEDEAAYDFYANVDAYAKEADESYKRPIVTRTFNHSWQMYDRHLYPGGAARLHMLRKEVGDEAFFRGVRTYVRRFAHRVVETDDFRRCIEEASGRSLVQFFDQWFFKKGYPRLEASWHWDEEKREGTLTIEQKQVDEKEGVEAFDFPLDVGWVLDGDTHVRTVRLKEKRETVVLRCDKEPRVVRLDPFGRTVMKLRFDPGGPMLRRQLETSEDVIGRILAAVELCRKPTPRNVAAVRNAYGRESFWGVKVRMAEALANAATAEAVTVLAELVGGEEDPMVLEHLIRHAGSIRDPRLRQAVERRLDAGLDLVRARAAALEALGAQREDAPLERLVAASRAPDRYGFLQGAALRALGQTRREEALEPLRDRLPPGTTPDRARPYAAHALGALARSFPKPVRRRVADRLSDLLRDPVDRVRKAAASGLSTLGESSAVPALEAFRRTLSDQEKVFVDRAVEGIRKAGESEGKGLEKQIDELRAKLRSLEASVQKLEARRTATEGPDQP